MQVNLECNVKGTIEGSNTKTASSESLSSRKMESVSLDSRMDYAVTAIQSSRTPVLVIMETKFNPNKAENAVAQVCTVCMFAL